MSSPKNSSNPADKPRLTEQEKKNNHIASEQKRRQAIREGFDRLANAVPGMEGQGRSEAVVLQATIDYIKEQIEERKRLLVRANSAGLSVKGYELDEGPGQNGTVSAGAKD